MYYFMQRPTRNYFSIYDDKVHKNTVWCLTLIECLSQDFTQKQKAEVQGVDAVLLGNKNSWVLFATEDLDTALDLYPEYFI